MMLSISILGNKVVVDHEGLKKISIDIFNFVNLGPLQLYYRSVVVSQRMILKEYSLDIKRLAYMVWLAQPLNNFFKTTL
jgi:hypothetical protein